MGYSREVDMPIYQATIIQADHSTPNCVFQFVAGSDLQAVARMPLIEGDCTLEIWRGERLVAMLDAGTVAVADGDLAAAAQNLIAGMGAGH
jgi:hypothetical protein